MILEQHCDTKLTTIGSDNGLSPGRRQASIWSNAGIVLIRTLGTNFSEIISKNHTFSFKEMHFKMSSEKWRQVCIGLNVSYNGLSMICCQAIIWSNPDIIHHSDLTEWGNSATFVNKMLLNLLVFGPTILHFGGKWVNSLWPSILIWLCRFWL